MPTTPTSQTFSQLHGASKNNPNMANGNEHLIRIVLELRDEKKQASMKASQTMVQKQRTQLRKRKGSAKRNDHDDENGESSGDGDEFSLGGYNDRRELGMRPTLTSQEEFK